MSEATNLFNYPPLTEKDKVRFARKPTLRLSLKDRQTARGVVQTLKSSQYGHTAEEVQQIVGICNVLRARALLSHLAMEGKVRQAGERFYALAEGKETE